MAKRKGGKRSVKNDAIRDILKDNPQAQPLEIEAELKKKKIRVNIKSINNVKHEYLKKLAIASGQATKKQGKQSARRKRKAVALSLQGLKSTQRLAGELGGVDNLREHVEALAVVQGVAG